VGIVRGASQRLVKLELTDQPNDELKDYIDEILTELDTGVGKYSLINLDDEDYRTDLNKLKNIWEAIQMDIVLVHEGNGHEKLLSDSEIYLR
ncbi:MAG: GGDEF domain-containing protein, partial [Streptococcus sp.]